MARIKETLPEPDQEIIMYQGTVDNLFNNTLVQDYYDFLKKVLNQGYSLKFKNDHLSDNMTEIESAEHLKNYFKDIQGHDFLI